MTILKAIRERLKTMTPEAFRASLMRAGIIRPNGDLASAYAKSARRDDAVRTMKRP